MPAPDTGLSTLCPLCCRLVPALATAGAGDDIENFLARHPQQAARFPYLADLAAVEMAMARAGDQPAPLPEQVERLTVNPTLELLPVKWSHLADLVRGERAHPEPWQGFVLVYRRPGNGELVVREAGGHDLLALKVVSEGLDTREAAQSGGVTVGRIDHILHGAGRIGLLLRPPSLLVREENYPRGTITDPDRFRTGIFTLQWHITQTCDLHCRHCYDRSERSPMPPSRAIRVLDDLYDFCQSHHVLGQVSFTGGNPLLYPHFNEIYQEAADRGFLTAILGNPMPGRRIEEILAIRRPEFYQVSLEGLEEHNDYIRGKGHFRRVLDFLALLREMDIYSMVMLTLTRANMDQVLQLAELLQGRADLFTFNRLAMVGEGAALASAPIDRFPGFLADYMEAAEKTPCMGLKDNFFNLVRQDRNLPLTGGCTGYGCGAAFNFVSLLPDGEVHACRKLPSLIGNLYRQSLAEIYHGRAARQYRLGPEGCRDCDIRPLCGGCLAVSYGFGRDIFSEPDPYCFRCRDTTS